MELKDKVALVTGGSGALGGRICHALADAGAHIAVLYHTGEERAQEISQELRDRGVKAEPFQCDVSAQDQIESVVGRVVQQLGRVDILVNDAGYNKWIPFPELDKMTGKEWNKMLTINLTAPMMFMKAVAGTMKDQGEGHIVNIASVAGLYPRGSSIGYAVSKAGLVHLTRCMAVAMAPEVLVNCVAPGFMEGTRMSNNLSPEFQERSRTSALLQRAADKDDVADQTVAFCRTDSITGQTLVIDSGLFFH